MSTKDLTALKADVSSTFPDNTTGLITPANHRTFLGNFIDSAFPNRRTVDTITSDTTIDGDYDVVLCDGSSGAITVTLPAVASSTNYQYTIFAVDVAGGNITVQANASENINGANTQTLDANYESITIVSDGSEWYIIIDRR